MTVFQIIILAAGLLGAFLIAMIIWAMAELPLILREIAINTRKNEGPDYPGVTNLSGLLKFAAVVVVLATSAAIIVIAVSALMAAA